MKRDWDANEQSIDEAVSERNIALLTQRQYYERLHFIELHPLNAKVYYEGLRDWSKFTEPKNTSRKDAEKDSEISGFLKIMALFSQESKSKLDDKKLKAEVLQKEYSIKFSKRVNRLKEQFYKRQEQKNSTIHSREEKLKMNDSLEVLEYFKAVLQSDEFTLDVLDSYELYWNGITMKEYNPETGALSYSYRIPNPEEVCVIDRFYYEGETDSITSRDLDKTRTINIRIKIARSILLRSAALIYYSDTYENVKTIHITGYLDYFDYAFGTDRYISVMSLEINKDIFNQINLESLKISDLFERVLKTKVSEGLYSKNPFELKGV